MKQAKKGPFNISVDLEQIPSYASRFASMDGLTANPIKLDLAPVDLSIAMDAEKDLGKKLGSRQDIRSNPGIILRRYGLQK